MPLDTLAQVKARLGITSSSDDTLLGLLQESAETFITQYCGRDFAGGTFTEYHPGSSDFILLRNYPIASLTSLKIDPSYAFDAESIVPSERYTVHAERGVVQSLLGPFLPRRTAGLVNSNIQIWTRGPRTVQVIYTTGTTVPADVREAHARLIGSWYRRVKTEAAAGFQDVRQQKFGDTFVIYGASPDGIPAEVETLLRSYRCPSL